MDVVTLDDVTLSYNGSPVLSRISFSARQGRILGLVGPNGSGKSTLIRAISRVISPVRGRILVSGQDVGKMKSREAARLVAVAPQNPELPKMITAFELVLMGRTPHLRFLQSEGKKDFAVVREIMDATGTADLAERRIGRLSGGELQKLTIARALAQEPDVLLLDEPTAYLDINHQKEILNLVRSLCTDKGLTVIVCLHDLNIASRYCHRLIMLAKGAIYAQGEPSEVLTEENIKQVYGTRVHVFPHPVNQSPTVLI